MTVDQFEKNIEVFRSGIESAKNGLAVVRAKKDVAAIFANYSRIVRYHVQIGLNRWRRGEDPRADFHAAIDQAELTLREIDIWQPTVESIDATDWNLIETIAWLVDRRIEVRRQSERIERAIDLALGELLVDALYDRPYRERVEPLLAELATKPRQELAAATYRTYFDLLDAGKGSANVGGLISQAQKNYSQRARDSFYSGGPGYMGGGPDNPYVVDWELSAVLRKIRWMGDTVHRWKWT
jgi:hypothetical protein